MAAVITAHPARLAVSALGGLLLACSAKRSGSDAAAQWHNAATLDLQNQNGVYREGGQPFSGSVYLLAANGKDTMAVGRFVDGKEDGEWRKYFAGGMLMERRSFLRGQKVDVYEAWWPNGKRRLLYHFADGEYEGSCRDWNDAGTLVNDMNYHRGYEDGAQKQYYDNGKIKANYIMTAGRRYGLLGTKNCVNVSDSVFKKQGL